MEHPQARTVEEIHLWLKFFHFHFHLPVDSQVVMKASQNNSRYTVLITHIYTMNN